MAARQESGIDRAAKVIAVMGACAILVVSGSVLVDVLMRWLFDAPVLAVDDLTDLNIAVAVACCMPAGMVGKRFVTIRFLGRALGPRAERWLEVFGDTLTLVFFAVLAWQFAEFAQSSDLGSMVLQIPQAPWWWVVTAVLVLCIPFQLAVVGRSIRSALA